MTHKKSILFFIVFISAISCSKIDEFGDINQNPGATTSPIPSALLTNVLAALGDDTWDAPTTGSIGLTTTCGLYCQYFSETLYTELSTYARPNVNWDNYYANRLYDLQIIINYNSDPATAATAAIYGSNNNQIAVARIMKVYLFSLLTDCYGDLPYSGALKADNGIVAFDPQATIYQNFFTELNGAVAQFDNGLVPKGDILFNGDLSMWRRFANSLYALLALRLSKIDAALGKEEFNAALSSPDGVFETDVNAELKYPGVNYLNPVYTYHLHPPFRIGVAQTMTDWLIKHNDNRITAYATSGVGFPYGLTRDSAIAFNDAHPDWAKVLLGELTSPSAPLPVITAGEIYLARAEAAQRGWTSEDVATMYENGIRESWKYWGVYDTTDFASYITKSDVSLTTGGNVLQKICEQEWAAHYPNGPRGWDVWRRTGYPNLVPAPGSNTPLIPRRVPYGNYEYATNPENANQAAARYMVNGETDSQYGRVWWDAE
ncbi:MAG TPA: SusD/RagB family nutrient-binding outer membrane lipoprotein [Chitinophagaceae bacterium]